MKFGDFLSKLEQGDDQFYMTTQKIPTDHNGPLSLMGEPVTRLLGDFPLRPALLGNLVPYQVSCTLRHSCALRVVAL